MERTRGRDDSGGQTLAALLSFFINDSLLFADASSPFHAGFTPGHPKAALVVGENASGKSLLARALCMRVRDAGPVPVSVSIRERTGGGMRQAMMFGEETDQSTGAISVNTVVAGFKNLDRPTGSLLCLDEPEIGLSDGYAAALGHLIGTRALTVPGNCVGVLVATHSRALARGLRDGLGADPHFVALGDSDRHDMDDWLNATEERDVAELLALPELGRQRWLAMNEVLKRP